MARACLSWRDDIASPFSIVVARRSRSLFRWSHVKVVDLASSSFQRGAAAELSTFISKMVAWWTRRSTAASVMAGPGNLRRVAKGLVGGDQQGAAFVAGGDELEQKRWSPPGPC